MRRLETSPAAVHVCSHIATAPSGSPAYWLGVFVQRLTGWFSGAAGVELTEADEPDKARKLRKMLTLFLQVLSHLTCPVLC